MNTPFPVRWTWITSAHSLTHGIAAKKRHWRAPSARSSSEMKSQLYLRFMHARFFTGHFARWKIVQKIIVAPPVCFWNSSAVKRMLVAMFNKLHFSEIFRCALFKWVNSAESDFWDGWVAKECKEAADTVHRKSLWKTIRGSKRGGISWRWQAVEAF